MCGKISEKSVSGAEYFLSFIDDKTRYVWVYFIHTKDQVFQKFREWKAMVEKSTGKALKAIRTDNGGEFTSREFEAYLKTEGVRHELTIPKNPEQNGVAERMNRTLIETARSMLINSKLPLRFWAEAVSTAAYLRNRSPTKSVCGMTPHEAWTGHKPNVDKLRVFGCQVFVHIPKDERKKLDSKSRKCVLLGYGADTKGYRIYDPLKGKAFHSRDVIFNEQKYGFDEPIQDAQQKHVQIEFSDEVSDTESSQLVPQPPPQPRRSERERRRTDFYGFQCNLTDVKEPTSVNDALATQEWMDAMRLEIDSLHENHVWEVVELPKGRKPVGSKWVYKVKTDANGLIERCKAHLVAQGYSQQEGLDYDETFSPVVRPESVHTCFLLHPATTCYFTRWTLPLHSSMVTCLRKYT